MAEAYIPVQQLETWSPQISTVSGAFASICGFFALFATGAMCKFSGLLQIATGLLVIAVEGPSFVPQLAFAAPLASIFESKPAWIKVAVYAVLTVIPTFPGCFKAFILGFLASLIVTVVHGLILLGKRNQTDEFGVQPVPAPGQTGNSMPNSDGAFSPTTP